MARRRTELEKQPHEAGEDRFTPFSEVFADSAADSATAEQPSVEGPAAGPAEDPEEILAEPPDTRDISAELAAPPRPRLPWLRLLLSGGVVAGLAFAGGALVEKGQLQGSAGSGSGSASAGRNPAAGAGGQGRTGFGQGGTGAGGQRQGSGGQGAGGQGQGTTGQGRTGTGQNGSRQGSGGATGGLGAGAGFTTGTVKLVDGTTLYVTDAQGNVVKITTDNNTQITEAKSGKVSDLQPGQTVTVRGSQSPSGDVAATTVAQGVGGGFGGGRG
ncbi:DUF5666 domain-containing protein [Streptomyces sp. NBC_00503]|uniref:DUF5666 domain-containing protein n=1 Tax=Streptomyces sp. NBC_00503 TaxID=2903659 RepID=UPI002E811ABA|nr:DUF5666 domain-containing protein [Streptomyces sp. NBC_00503]WUD85253.1 DUF5666 domain-containing protein [Streptomyces sp. NBC_00503]